MKKTIAVPQPTGTPAFELNTPTWHVQVLRAPNGTAVIVRVRGSKRTKPATWESDRTPEDWVNIQRDAAQYTTIH